MAMSRKHYREAAEAIAYALGDNPSPEPTVQELTTDLLTDIQKVWDTYLVFPSPEARDAVTLWTAHAHVVDAFQSTPRLAVNSTEPGSGKSRVLEILEYLTPDPLYAVYVHPAILWRTIENSAHPTLLLDEVDTIFGKAGSGSAHIALRGILNAGHRKGATVPRCVGTSDVKRFAVYAPVAMAGLGQLPDTLASRSIQIQMRRKHKGEHCEPFRAHLAEPILRRIRMQAEAWATVAHKPLSVMAPDMAPLQDRPADVWEAVYSIADLAEGDWPQRVRKAAKMLTAKPGTQSAFVALLMDLKWIYGTTKQLPTAELVQRLTEEQDLPSGTDWSGMINPRSLAAMLKQFDVTPATIRTPDGTAKGYKLADLEDPFSRYVEEES